MGVPASKHAVRSGGAGAELLTPAAGQFLITPDAVLLIIATGALLAARRIPNKPVGDPGPVADQPSGTAP